MAAEYRAASQFDHSLERDGTGSRRGHEAYDPASASVTTFLRNEARIAWRLLVLGAVAYFAIVMALRVQIVSAAVIVGFAEVSMLWPVERRLRRWGLPAVVAALLCVLALSRCSSFCSFSWRCASSARGRTWSPPSPVRWNDYQPG
jgi:hypothetical protein